MSRFVQSNDSHLFAVDEVFLEDSWKLDIDKMGFLGKERRLEFNDYLKVSLTTEIGLQDVLNAYYISSKYFKRQGKYASAAFQYKKILHVLKVVIKTSLSTQQDKDRFYGFLQNTIVQPILRYVAQDSGNADRHMINKADSLDIRGEYAKNNISIHPELREVNLLFAYIQLKIGEDTAAMDLKFLISSNNSIAAQYARIQELDFYAKFLQLELSDDMFKIPTRETLLSKCVNYLYTMLSILQILDIYGYDYWLGYSYSAYTHYKIGEFLTKNFLQQNLKEINNELIKLFGTGSYASLDAYAHFAKASELYGQAIRLHNAGEEYKKVIDDMIYLEDDFNDSAYHFGAALDRYMIRNGLFTKHLDICKARMAYLKKLDFLKLYDPPNS